MLGKVLLLRNHVHHKMNIVRWCLPQHLSVSDKNSLFDRGSIGEMEVYVNFFSAYAPSCGWGLGADVFEMSVEASIFWTGI